MIAAEIPENEQARIHKLKELGILDTLEEQAYDDLTLLASQICDTPIALVSLVDQDRQWFKSHLGLAARETPRELAFCAHAILGDDVFVVEDSNKDVRFRDNPLVTGEPNVRFYAGAPLIMESKLRLGTLCVISNEARTMSESQKRALAALSRQVVSLLELRLKVKELEYLDHAKDEFLSMVSHELRTPLTSIGGSLSLLLNNKAGNIDGKPRDMVEIAYRNTDRLLKIVNDILDMTRLEARKLEIVQEPVEMLGLLQRAVELNQIFCDKCGVRVALTRSGVSAPIIVLGDEHRLLQVLTNLVSNAAKFTHDGDTIEVSVALSGENVRIAVTDHGPGIAVTDQRLLFQKFRQVGISANQKMPGTGLGLNISKNLIELHHGKIGCESVPGEKTTFYFTLPLADQNA